MNIGEMNAEEIIGDDIFLPDDEGNKLFVGSLYKETTVQEIKQIFSAYVELDDIYIVPEHMSCAYVKCKDKDMALNAINEVNGTRIGDSDRLLVVRFADRLNTEAIKNQVNQICSKYGQVEDVYLKVDEHTGYGFVKYEKDVEIKTSTILFNLDFRYTSMLGFERKLFVRFDNPFTRSPPVGCGMFWVKHTFYKNTETGAKLVGPLEWITEEEETSSILEWIECSPDEGKLLQFAIPLKNITDSTETSTSKTIYFEVKDLPPAYVMEEIRTLLEKGKTTLAETGKYITYLVPSLDNTIYDKKLSRICLVKGRSIKCQERTSAKITKVLKILYESFRTEVCIDKRTIYYLDEKPFKNQETSDGILDKICLMLDCTRRSLNVFALERGWVIGCLCFTENGEVNNCLRCSSDAYFILIVEKMTVYRSLCHYKFYEHYPCIIVRTP